MDNSPLQCLPDELLEAIAAFLPPADTIAFGSTCKLANKIAYEHLLWRAHCVQGWLYWESRHDLEEKMEQPPASTQWRRLYNQRQSTDQKALQVFNDLLKTQQFRIQRMEEISALGYDVKDMLLRLRDGTPDDAEDVLARRWYADAALGQLHRKTALEKWARLSSKQMVKLEEVLGAYDLFILGGRKGDLRDLDVEFNRLAQEVRNETEGFDDLSTRRKAVKIAQYLRGQGLVGNPSIEDYHALRNNFLSMALFDDVHTSLPLQSVAIYCAVARRLGVNAKPSNYPEHVHAVVEAPADLTLDGGERSSTKDECPQLMLMDPWRASEETPYEHLTLRLSQMGVPPNQRETLIGATSNLAITLRAGRNIMYSVQEARDRQRGTTRRPPYPDAEAAWYSMLWSMMILGDPDTQSNFHRRRQCLPYITEHFQQHFPEDLGLVENIIGPMFEGEREHHVLMHVFNNNRAGDRNAKAPCRRDTEEQKKVQYKIGQIFQHKRYGYEGFIIGWDSRCTADPRWVHQMRVDELPRGREQPFYNVM
jgi:F-box protein 21